MRRSVTLVSSRSRLPGGRDYDEPALWISGDNGADFLYLLG